MRFHSLSPAAPDICFYYKPHAGNFNRKSEREKYVEDICDNVREAIKAAGLLEFAVKASEEGKIYGSVSNAQVAEALAAKGANVEKKQIVLDNIKVLGEYVAVAKLHRDVTVEIPVKVVAEAAE